MLLGLLLFSIFANVNFVHAQSPSSQGSLKTDYTQYQLSLEHTVPVKITGKVSGERGDRVELTITKPDGTSDVSYSFLTNTGDFVSIYMLDKNSPVGQYQVSANHNGAIVSSTSFSVISAQPTSGSTTVTAPQYQLYKNDDYGFSIEYPSNWGVTNHFEEGAAIVGVGFSPDKNLQVDVGVQKNNNPFVGMTDQQSLDSITTMLKNRCYSATLQKTGFTCSQDQYNQNVVDFQGSSAYLVASGLVKTFPDGSSIRWISEWLLIPKGNDVWVMVVETSSVDFNTYSDEITRMGNSLNIYGITQQNVPPTVDYSNFGLQKGESISYKYSIKVQASDAETQQAVTNSMLQSLANQIGDVTLNSIDDIEWMKYTVTDISSTNILFDEEVKVRNYNVIEHQRDMKYLTGTAIPIDAKIGNSYDMFSGGGSGMLQGTVDKITTIKMGNTDVPVFELSGSSRNVSQDGSTVTTMNVTAYYDKQTGIGLKALIDMNVVGAKYVKMHMELNTIQWSGLGNQPVQPPTTVPSWIKNTAKWWSEGSLSDADFIKGIQYLIQEGIVTVPATQPTSQPSQGIPTWVKNTAKWWSQGQVSDSDFIMGIQYLVQNGMISTTIPPITLDTASQTVGENGGSIILSGGSSVAIPSGVMSSGQPISLKLLTSLPQQPPSGVIVGVGPALEISFGTTQVSYHDLNFVPSANAQTQSSSPIQVTLNTGKTQATGISGSVGIADVVDLQGKDHFVGIPETCDPSYSTCKFALNPSILSHAKEVIASQANLNTMITGEVAPKLGERIWNGQQFVAFPQGFDPNKKTLVVTHGMISNVESAYGDCINDLMAAGNYDQVIGFNYDFTKNIETNGKLFANFLDSLKKLNVSQVDIEAHSEGTVVTLAAAGLTSMKINNMILEGGPIDGTPIASYALTTILANSPVSLPVFGDSLKKMYESGLMSELQPGSKILQDIKQNAVSHQPGANFIRVVGTSPYLLESAAIYGAEVGAGVASTYTGFSLDISSVDPFNGQPNDGMIPVSSAMGTGLPGPTPLYYKASHTGLACNPDSLKGVGYAVNQHPLPSSASPPSSTTGSTTGSPSQATAPSTTQGQSVRGCAGYRTCEDYCQYEIGSDYHYDASTNNCHQTATPSTGTSGGGAGSGTGGVTSGGSQGQGISSTTGGGLTGHWSGTFTFADTSAGVTCTFHSTFEADLVQTGNDVTGTITYAPARYTQPLSGGSSIECGFIGLSYSLGGTVFGSSFTGTSSDGSLRVDGSFTSDLIRGTFKACGEGGCDEGSFQGSRTR